VNPANPNPEQEPDMTIQTRYRSNSDRLSGPALASDKQTTLIAKLLDEKEMGSADRFAAKTALETSLLKSEASAMITWLLAMPRKASPSPTAQPAREEITEDGMYRTEDGTIYKVQRAVHGSGQLYAKRLTVVPAIAGGEAQVSFDYAPGAVRKLAPSDRMTLAQAKEFGALYGSCCVCGRTLTREESIEAGIGPVCAGRFA
jgi:hypothetical protein